MSKLDAIFVRVNRPLPRVDNLVCVVSTVSGLVGFANSSDANADKCSAGFGLVITQALVIGTELLHRPGDRIVDLRIVVFVPTSKIFMSPKLKAGNDPRPIEPPAAVRAVLAIGKHQLRVDQSIRDLGLRIILAGSDSTANTSEQTKVDLNSHSFDLKVTQRPIRQMRSEANASLRLPSARQGSEQTLSAKRRDPDIASRSRRTCVRPR